MDDVDRTSVPTKRWARVEYERLVDLADREHKGSLYARAQVPDYWIVNLVDRVLEVYRDPTSSADAPYGWRFNTLLPLGAADVVTPLAAPEARIPIADLLP